MKETLGKKSNRDKSFKGSLKSPAIVAGSLRKSNTRLLSSDLNKLYDSLKYLIQDKQARRDSDIINEEIVAIADKLSEYNCTSIKQNNFSKLKCLR